MWAFGRYGELAISSKLLEFESNSPIFFNTYALPYLPLRCLFASFSIHLRNLKSTTYGHSSWTATRPTEERHQQRGDQVNRWSLQFQTFQREPHTRCLGWAEHLPAGRPPFQHLQVPGPWSCHQQQVNSEGGDHFQGQWVPEGAAVPEQLRRAMGKWTD